MDTILGPDESLFKAFGVLEQEYLPRELPHREQKLIYLSQAIKEANSKPSLFIYGPPGIGKTASVRWVFRKCEESDEQIFPLYINCWKYSKSKSIRSKLSRYFGIRRIGKSDEEITEFIIRKLQSFDKLAIAWDEVDHLKDYELLYRSLEEISSRTTFLITTKREWLAKLDERLRSRLLPEHLKFEPYSFNETKEILQNRIKYAFVKGVWSGKAFDLVVRKCHQAHDLRVGLLLLREAGKLAESDSSRSIKLKYAKAAFEKIESGKKKLDDF